MSSRISSMSGCPICRRRIVHSRSTNPDLSGRLNVTPALFAVYLDLFFRPQLYRAVNGYHRRINAASRTGLALGMKGWVSVLLFVVLKKKTATRRSYFFDGLEKCQIGDCARRARHGPRLI